VQELRSVGLRWCGCCRCVLYELERRKKNVHACVKGKLPGKLGSHPLIYQFGDTNSCCVWLCVRVCVCVCVCVCTNCQCTLVATDAFSAAPIKQRCKATDATCTASMHDGQSTDLNREDERHPHHPVFTRTDATPGASRVKQRRRGERAFTMRADRHVHTF
jgi:hypothetical protein